MVLDFAPEVTLIYLGATFHCCITQKAQIEREPDSSKTPYGNNEEKSAATIWEADESVLSNLDSDLSLIMASQHGQLQHSPTLSKSGRYKIKPCESSQEQ